MTADELVTAYVDDVTRLLPYRQQPDVARELRALFHEALDERPPGRARDEAALRMLQEFGRPAEAAARYGHPVSVIDQADTRGFVRWSVVGVLAIWLAGAVTVETFPQWWLGVAIPALWWPGVLVVGYGLAAWTRRRRPESATWKPRRGADGRVNRPGRIAALMFFVAGTVVLVFAGRLLQWVSGGAVAPEAVRALTFDEDFLHVRGPLVLACVILEIVLYAAATVAGRRSRGLRRAETASNVVMAVVFTVVLLGGPILQAEDSDALFRTVLAASVALAVTEVLLHLQRLRRQAG